MKTVSMLAQKGGTGKTTLGIHLAVEASHADVRVLLVDVDPQASATTWWRRRRAETPDLVASSGASLADVLETAAAKGYDLAIIDSAPHSLEASHQCARHSDRVCIPTRPAILDLDAIGASTDLVAPIGVPTEIVLNACPPPTRFGEPRIVAEAREALSVYGTPVCDVAVSQRAIFGHALIDGRTASELDQKGKAAEEIRRLWGCLKQELAI